VIGTNACVALPGALRWLREPLIHSHGIAGELFVHSEQRRIAAASTLIGVYSVGIAVANMVMGDESPDVLAGASLVSHCFVCICLYQLIANIDRSLARSMAFVFLQGALVPRSSIIFEWSHAPALGNAVQDDRCFSPMECAALHPATAGADGLECGWARARDWPCITPAWRSVAHVAGSLALVGGTVLYSTHFQHWSFRRITSAAILLHVAVNLLDLVWVMRLNVSIGLPDHAFLVGDEVISDFVSRFISMPMHIYAAKLCPPGVEASVFALFMGLMNLGKYAGTYLGSSLLLLLGEAVSKPGYDRLPEYVMLCTVLRALPMLLVPFLVPEGTAGGEMRVRSGRGRGGGEGEGEG